MSACAAAVVAKRVVEMRACPGALRFLPAPEDVDRSMSVRRFCKHNRRPWTGQAVGDPTSHPRCRTR